MHVPTAPAVLALEPLQPPPTRWEPQQSGNGRARGGSGCAAHVPRGSGCTRLEDASTRVESQKGLSSRTASTEGLSSFLRRLDGPGRGCMAASGTQCLQERQPKRREPRKKNTVLKYTSVRRDGRNWGQLLGKLTPPVLTPAGGGVPGAALDSRGKGTTRGPWSVWTVLGTSFIILCGHLTG